jgi:hypothetical protein
MPVFLDVHKVPFSEANLKELCASPTDEFGVRHVNLLYNKDAKVCFCLLEGPDIDAIEKHHSKVNIKCEWITEVSLAQPFQRSDWVFTTLIQGSVLDTNEAATPSPEGEGREEQQTTIPPPTPLLE